MSSQPCKPLHADLGQTGLTALQSPQPPPIEAVLTGLVNEIADTDSDWLLVCDDFHVITAQDTHTFVQTFGASHRFVLDYLVEEVLDRQPTEIQTFLLETSMLERLTAPLCDAVREKTTGGQEKVQLVFESIVVSYQYED